MENAPAINNKHHLILAFKKVVLFESKYSHLNKYENECYFVGCQRIVPRHNFNLWRPGVLGCWGQDEGLERLQLPDHSVWRPPGGSAAAGGDQDDLWDLGKRIRGTFRTFC